MDLLRGPSTTSGWSHVRGWSLSTAAALSFESTQNVRVPIGNPDAQLKIVPWLRSSPAVTVVTALPARTRTRLYVLALSYCKPQRRTHNTTLLLTSLALRASLTASPPRMRWVYIGTTGLPEEHPGVSEYLYMDGKQRLCREAFYAFATNSGSSLFRAAVVCF